MKKKLTIIGGGIIGALEAYFAYQVAKEKGEEIRITIYEKNASESHTTAANIVPSLTPDEILSVIPPGPVLVEKLGILFSQPGGIKVEDVMGVNDSEAASDFIKMVQQYSQDRVGHESRVETLLRLGKISMDMWQKFYDEADPELQQILRESNFNPCRESQAHKPALHDGYRIDLIYNIPNAESKAKSMAESYDKIGYKHCQILDPDEVKKLDPYLAEFCDMHSEINKNGKKYWKNDAVALYRPGGCIDTEIFLPKFYEYLSKKMGTYVNEEGKTKNCFRLKLDRLVSEISFNKTMQSSSAIIDGLRFAGGESIKKNKSKYAESKYLFCTGESVGTMRKLGFSEPAYSRFAGASLRLNIPINEEMLKQISNFNHCMEVHQEGVVLAWQARCRDNKIFIGVAGTKAFYGDKSPELEHKFAQDRNLLQLNMINDVLPQFISIALGRNTTGQQLKEDDLRQLVGKGIATCWAGTRAVAFDGFPTLGAMQTQAGEVVGNARCTTHLGSGGVSFAHAAIFMSKMIAKGRIPDKLTEQIKEYSFSGRRGFGV